MKPGCTNLTNQIPPKVKRVENSGSTIKKLFQKPEMVELNQKMPPRARKINANPNK